MDIPVGNEDTLDAVAMLSVARPNGDVIEQAETHAAVVFGMVARRANQAKGGWDVAVEDGVDGRNDAAGRTRCAFE
jgi:hypothetical protein